VLPLGEDFVKPVGEEQVKRDKAKLEERFAEDASKQKSQAEADNERLKSIPNPMSVNEAKPLGRILFMAGGALANFVSAFLLFIVVALIGLPEMVGARVNIAYVTPDSPAAIAGLQPRDVVEQINGENFASPEDFFAQLNSANSEPVMLTVRRGESGELVQVEVTPQVVENTLQTSYVRIMAVVEGSPAEQSGLLPGDLILSFNGEIIANNDELIAATDAHLGEEVNLEMLRADGTQATVTLTPRVNPPEGQGPMGISINIAATDANSGIVYQLGIPQTVYASQSLPNAISYGAARTSEAIGMVLRLPIDLISGRLTAEEARPVSVVAISHIGGQFLAESIQENRPTLILNYIALISIALGVTNLLPIPALDGGRILFVLIEIVRGRPLKPEFEGVIHLVGLVLLLSVAVVFILNDIINPITLP